jgi:hypothetical protein
MDTQVSTSRIDAEAALLADAIIADAGEVSNEIAKAEKLLSTIDMWRSLLADQIDRSKHFCEAHFSLTVVANDIRTRCHEDNADTAKIGRQFTELCTLYYKFGSTSDTHMSTLRDMQNDVKKYVAASAT